MGSLDLLTAACSIFRRLCVADIQADRDRCRSHVDASTAVITALVEKIGYEKASEIARAAQSNNQTIRQVVIDGGLMSAAEFDALISPESVMRLGSRPPLEGRRWQRTIAFRRLTPRRLERSVSVSRASTARSWCGIFPTKTLRRLDCFPNVARKVQSCGGAVVYGWTLREWPMVLIEAEFHAVWETPDQNMVDITPSLMFPVPDEDSRILFMIDATRKYDGRQVNNVRLPTTDGVLPARFIALWELKFAIENLGGRSMQRWIHFHEVELPHQEWILRQIEIVEDLLDAKRLSRRSLSLQEPEEV